MPVVFGIAPSDGSSPSGVSGIDCVNDIVAFRREQSGGCYSCISPLMQWCSTVACDACDTSADYRRTQRANGAKADIRWSLSATSNHPVMRSACACSKRNPGSRRAALLRSGAKPRVSRFMHEPLASCRCTRPPWSTMPSTRPNRSVAALRPHSDRGWPPRSRRPCPRPSEVSNPCMRSYVHFACLPHVRGALRFHLRSPAPGGSGDVVSIGLITGCSRPVVVAAHPLTGASLDLLDGDQAPVEPDVSRRWRGRRWRLVAAGHGNPSRCSSARR